MSPRFSAPADHVQPEAPWVRADPASGARLRSPRRRPPPRERAVRRTHLSTGSRSGCRRSSLFSEP